MSMSKVVLAALLWMQALPGEALHNSTSNATDAIDLVYYEVLPDGSSPLVCTTGRACLERLSEEPQDAAIFEELSESPTYDTIVDVFSHRQRDVQSLITGLWYLFGAVILVSSIVTLLRVYGKECGGSDRQTVTTLYMTAYVGYTVALGVLLICLIYLLVCIISTSSTMGEAITQKAPNMYANVFANLRAYVRATVQEVTASKKGSSSANVMKEAKDILTVNFRKRFKAFIAENVMADLNVPLYHMARDCANDVYHLGRLLSGNASQVFKSIGDQYALVHRGHEQLFRQVVQMVDDWTAVERLRLARALTNSMLSTAVVGECEDGGKTTLSGIDAMESRLDTFEKNFGVYEYMSGTFMSLLFWHLVLLTVAVALLLVTLAIGLSVHNPKVRTHRRSVVSHLVGALFVAVAWVFLAYVISGIPLLNRLTAYSALGECFLCAPFRKGHYDVIDDAVARLWPPSNRSELFTRLVPSEIYRKCESHSVSILDLGPPLPPKHKLTPTLRSVYSNVLPNPPKTMEMLSSSDQLYSVDHEDLSRTLLGALKNLSNVSSPGGDVAKDILNKWSHFKSRRSFERLNRSAVKAILVPMIPAYYNRFLKHEVALVEDSLSQVPPVVAPCYVVYTILSAIMDVICGNFTTELVGHWFAVFVAVLLSILVIILSLAFSKYYFRTRLPRRLRLHRGRIKKRVSSPELLTKKEPLAVEPLPPAPSKVPRPEAFREPSTEPTSYTPSTSSFRQISISTPSARSVLSVRQPILPPRIPARGDSYTVRAPIGQRYRLVAPTQPTHTCTSVMTRVTRGSPSMTDLERTMSEPMPLLPLDRSSEPSTVSMAHVHMPGHLHLVSHQHLPHHVHPPLSHQSFSSERHTPPLYGAPEGPVQCRHDEVTEVVRHISSHTHFLGGS